MCLCVELGCNIRGHLVIPCLFIDSTHKEETTHWSKIWAQNFGLKFTYVQVTFKILCAHTMDGHVKMGGFNLVLEKFIVQSLHQY